MLQGRITVSGKSMDKSGQFSQGLVSAAQMVAAATGSMCEAANDLVIGQASEEKLEAAARQVSGATSQLLVACKGSQTVLVYSTGVVTILIQSKRIPTAKQCTDSTRPAKQSKKPPTN